MQFGPGDEVVRIGLVIADGGDCWEWHPYRFPSRCTSNQPEKAANSANDHRSSVGWGDCPGYKAEVEWQATIKRLPRVTTVNATLHTRSEVGLWHGRPECRD